MLVNYVKLALRNLRRYRLQTLLNLGGLSVGFACCLLITLYILGELSYDRQHRHADRIWRVTRSFLNQDGSEDLHLSSIAPPFGTLLPRHFPEIEKITRMLPANGVMRTSDNRLFPEKNIFFADEQLADVFDLPMKSGSPATLAEPWQLLLSEKTATRFFGNRNPAGEVLELDNRYRFKVAGVFADYPEASHFHPDILLSFNTLRDSAVYGERNLQTNFSNNSFYTYILTARDFDAGKMAARFPEFLDAVFPPPPPGADSPRKPHEFTRLHLQPLSDIHLNSHHDDEIEPGGDMARIRLFAAVAFLILLIACINYVNLSTAFSLGRIREIGVRKSVGAGQSQVMTQFLTESILLAACAALMAGALSVVLLPLLEQQFDIRIPIDRLFDWRMAGILLAATLLTGLLAGFYPAFFMSAFRPVGALKGSSSVGRRNDTMRKSLVVAQFALTTILLIGTGVIYSQLHYLRHKSLGYDREHVINLPLNEALTSKWESFRSELLKDPSVTGVARSSRLPSGRLLDDLGGTSVQLGDTMVKLSAVLRVLAVDMDFAETYNIPLAAGRMFSRTFMSDTAHAWMLNETAVRAIGWRSADEAIGKRLVYGGQSDSYVVGVLKDFHFESLHQEIQPMIFVVPPNNQFLNNISIKLSPNTAKGLAYAGQVWQKFCPDFLFDYAFLDESYGRLYESEQRQGQLFLVFSVLAVFVACLGLFGLATYAAHRRTREIGVRKVLGASVSSVAGLLAREFLQLVVLAIFIATPLSWYLMSRWLADFAYHTELEWWMFAAAGVLAVLVALLTVGFQSIRAALMNPVRSLRSE